MLRKRRPSHGWTFLRLTQPVAEPTAETALFAAVGQEMRDAVAVHLSTARADLRFQRQILLVLAVLEGTAGRDRLEAVDYRLAHDAASDAAAVCRTQAPSTSIFAVVDRLDDVVRVCARALALRAEDGWQRFLFADANLEVICAQGSWRVRTAGAETESRRLESALNTSLPGTAEARIAELAEQIIAWCPRASISPDGGTMGGART